MLEAGNYFFCWYVMRDDCELIAIGSLFFDLWTDGSLVGLDEDGWLWTWSLGVYNFFYDGFLYKSFYFFYPIYLLAPELYFPSFNPNPLSGTV